MCVCTEYPMTMRLYVQTLPELHDAMYMYYQWVTLRQLVYAVDIRHNCDDPEFEPVTNNEHSIMKVILFDNNSYYALRLMNSLYGEEIPGNTGPSTWSCLQLELQRLSLLK